MSHSAAGCSATLARRPGLGAVGLLAPGVLWLALFFLVPMLLMLAASVMPRGTYGGVEPGFTLEHYRRFLDPLYLQVLLAHHWLGRAGHARSACCSDIRSRG